MNINNAISISIIALSLLIAPLPSSAQMFDENGGDGECNPFGCSPPDAPPCNPFGCPKPGGDECTPFGCPPGEEIDYEDEDDDYDRSIFQRREASEIEDCVDAWLDDDSYSHSEIVDDCTENTEYTYSQCMQASRPLDEIEVSDRSYYCKSGDGLVSSSDN
jgi:hypothetical protein